MTPEEFDKLPVGSGTLRDLQLALKPDHWGLACRVFDKSGHKLVIFAKAVPASITSVGNSALAIAWDKADNGTLIPAILGQQMNPILFHPVLGRTKLRPIDRMLVLPSFIVPAPMLAEGGEALDLADEIGLREAEINKTLLLPMAPGSLARARRAACQLRDGEGASTPQNNFEQCINDGAACIKATSWIVGESVGGMAVSDSGRKVKALTKIPLILQISAGTTGFLLQGAIQRHKEAA